MCFLQMMRVVFVCIYWLNNNAESAPLHYTEISVDALQYMSINGYLNLPDPRIGQLLDENTIKKSLESLQRFGNIPVTGVLDDKTVELIETPRCGLPDISRSHDTRKKKYALQGTKWNKNNITWKLINDNNDGLNRNQVENVIQKAVSRWEAVTNLNFRKIEVNSKEVADIEVSFGIRYHRDAYPFDGPGGVLAHGFYPSTNEGISGDLHFDDDEVFTIGTSEGRNLLWVAVHEIGHCIGLEHSNIRESIMYPWYKGYMGEDFPLTQDDIYGIQTLYGSKKQTRVTDQVTTTVLPVVTSSGKDLLPTCSMKGAVFDKVTRITYIFNGKNLFKIDENLQNVDGPYNVEKILPDVKSIDSAYVNSKSEIVFFKGTSYYIYSNLSVLVLLEKGSIFDKFIGLRTDTKKIDAAFIWPGNGKTYLFSGDLFYRFSDYSNIVYYDYPREISKFWGNVPSPVDAVFAWKNGVTYFFRGTGFYRMTDKVEIEKYYPKAISGAWMKCVN